MILCLDIGNSHIFGGVFANNQLHTRFRYASQAALTSDAFGVFLKGVLQENRISASDIEHIAMSSVVPHLAYSVRSACRKYFSITPFELSVEAKLPIKIQYQTLTTLGVDRIANAVGAAQRFPNRPVIIASFGTATTICAINEKKAYLGGAIMPGFRIARDCLAANTAKLPVVEILHPPAIIGNSTESCIQTGLYHSQLGAVKELVAKMQPMFSTKAVVIGTGGFSHLFSEEEIFDYLLPDLILEGLYVALTFHQAVDPVSCDMV